MRYDVFCCCRPVLASNSPIQQTRSRQASCGIESTVLSTVFQQNLWMNRSIWPYRMAENWSFLLFGIGSWILREGDEARFAGDKGSRYRAHRLSVFS